MEAVILGINQNWMWLGPLLVICFGTALIWLCVDIFGEVQKEMEDGTEEWEKFKERLKGFRL